MGDKFSRYDIKGFAYDMEVDMLTISSLYAEYFSEVKSNIDDCLSFLQKKDWQMLQRRIHNVKGISSTLRIEDIYTAANTLDMDLKRGEYLNVHKGILEIISLLRNAEKDIKDFFSKNNIII